MAKRKKFMALALALALVLSACGNGAGSGGTDGTSAGGSGGNGAATAARTDMNSQLYSEVTTMDPTMSASSYDMAVMYQIYDSMFEPIMGDYNNLAGSLCESYDVDEAAMNYTFHIRQNVLWHNGDTLTAEDIVFSINRMRESPVTQARIAFVTDVILVDDYTVEVVCSYPSPRLPALLSTVSMSVVNKNLIETYGDNAPETVIGTGAYKLESWTAGQGMVLTAFEEGWRGSPAIKTINYSIISDPNAARIAFQNGELDSYYAATATDVALFADDPNIVTTEYQLATIDSLAFNSSLDGWTSNQKFRQAAAHAIDRDGLTMVATDGLYTTVDSVIPEGNLAYGDPTFPYEYNPEKAKQLLEEIGYDGTPVGLLYTSSYDMSNTWGTTVEAYLRAVGINVDMQGQDYASVVQRVTGRDYEMCLFEYSVSFPDPLSSVYAMFRSDGFYNVWQYYNDELDAQILSLYGIADQAALAAELQAIDEMAQELCLYVPNYAQGGYNFRPAKLISESAPEPMFGWVRICYSHWEA